MMSSKCPRNVLSIQHFLLKSMTSSKTCSYVSNSMIFSKSIKTKTSYGEVYVLINGIQWIKSFRTSGGHRRNNQSKQIQSRKHDFSRPREWHSRGRQRQKLHVQASQYFNQVFRWTEGPLILRTEHCFLLDDVTFAVTRKTRERKS